MRRSVQMIARLAAALAMTSSVLTSRARAQPSRSEIEHLASQDTALRILVSTAQRRLRVLQVNDTLLLAPVAVGSSKSMAYGDQHWTFTTPIGVRTVIAKDSAPEWIPPDWHYVEVARREHTRLLWLHHDTSFVLRDGTTLVFRGGHLSIEDDSTIDHVSSGDDLIVDDKLLVPPIGSAARRVPGELGMYRLSLGDGFAIHGTPDQSSVGRPATHGCMRLHDADIEWLYRHVPAGTRVYIY